MPLKLGDTGPAVTTLQNQLMALGFPLIVDGSFGPRTDDAVRGLQLVVGIPVNGIVGPSTNAALTSGDWTEKQSALCFSALGRIVRTDTTTTALTTTIGTADVKFPIALPDQFEAPDINPGLRALAAKVVATTLIDPPTPEPAFGPTTIEGEIEPTLLVGSLFAVHGDLSEFFSGAAA